MFPSDERVQAVCGDNYKSYKGYIGHGVFLTVDDAYLVVNVNVFDKLVNEATFTEHVESKSGVSTYEEAKELYADRIIQEYLAEEEVKKQELVAQEVAEHNTRVKQVKMKSLQKANNIRSRYADTKRKNILEMLLKGCKPAEIISSLGYTSSVVYKALSTFEPDFVFDCYNNDFVKKHVIREADFQQFVNLDFNYKKYLKYINGNKNGMSKPPTKTMKEPIIENVEVISEIIHGTGDEELDAVIKLFSQESEITANVVDVVKVDADEELPAYLTRKIDPELDRIRRREPVVVMENGYTVLGKRKKKYY